MCLRFLITKLYKSKVFNITNIVVNQEVGILNTSYVKQRNSIIDLNTNYILSVIQLLNFVDLMKTFMFYSPDHLYKIIAH